MRISFALLFVVAIWIPSEPQAPAQQQPDKKPRVDAFGDPLPEGAVARLGTVRWRHAGSAVFLKFLPANKTLLSVGRDGFIYVWDVGTGKVVRSIALGFTKPVISSSSRDGIAVAVSPDSKVIAVCWARIATSGGAGGPGKLKAAIVQYEGPYVQRWEVESGKELPPLQGMDRPAVAMDFSHDGKSLATTDFDGLIKVWDASNGKQITSFVTSADSVVLNPTSQGSLRFTPDGGHLLLVSEVQSPNRALSVQRWHLATKMMVSASQHADTIAALIHSFSPDNERVYLTTSEGAIVEQEAVSGRELRRITSGFARVKALASSPENKRLYSRMPGEWTVIEWDVESAKELRHFGRPAKECPPLMMISGSGVGHACLAVSSDGRLLATGGDGHSIRIYELATGKELTTEQNPTFAPHAVSFMADSKKLLTWSTAGDIFEWDCATAKSTRRIAVPGDAESFAVSPNGDYLSLQMPSGEVILTESGSGKKLVTLATEKPRSVSYVFFPDSQRLALRIDEQGHIKFFEVPSGKAQAKVSVKPRPFETWSSRSMVVGALLPSPAGNTIIAFIERSRVGLFTTVLGKSRHEISLPSTPNGQVHGAIFSADGRSFAIDLEDGTVHVFETSTAKLRLRLGDSKNPRRGDRPWWEAPAFGVYLDGKAPTLPLCRQTVAFSPDGRTVAFREKDRRVTLFDVPTGKEISRLSDHQGGVTAVAFSPHGQWLATTGADTTTLLWDMASVRK